MSRLETVAPEASLMSFLRSKEGCMRAEVGLLSSRERQGELSVMDKDSGLVNLSGLSRRHSLTFSSID